jgi:ATP-dependent Lon protease
MNTSPDRGSFHIECELKRVEEGEKTPEEAQHMIEFYKSWEELRREHEATDEWKVDNMEYDLRSTKWICDKAKASEAYAQNLYAAMCNNEFIKNDVWPILTNKRWSASWRCAGGILANMVEKGDYIDWYCSGIRNDISDEEYNELSKEQQEYYLYTKTQFVSESVVTDEVREDLLKLGWICIDDNEEKN